MREIKIFHAPSATPEEWRVEEYDDDDGVAVTVFTGPGAERNAKEFAERLRYDNLRGN